MRIVQGALVLALAGCTASQGYQPPAPMVDMSPLACGYMWSQSGHAQIACSDYVQITREKKTVLAREDAWRIARVRCPDVCPPSEVEDTVTTAAPEHTGTCYSGIVYFPQRILFRCERAD